MRLIGLLTASVATANIGSDRWSPRSATRFSAPVENCRIGRHHDSAPRRMAPPRRPRQLCSWDSEWGATEVPVLVLNRTKKAPTTNSRRDACAIYNTAHNGLQDPRIGDLPGPVARAVIGTRQLTNRAADAQASGATDTVAPLARGHTLGDQLEEIIRLQPGARPTGVPGQSGGDRDGHSTGDALVMSMGHLGRPRRLVHEQVQMIGKVRPERGHSHGGAIAKGTLAA